MRISNRRRNIIRHRIAGDLAWKTLRDKNWDNHPDLKASWIKLAECHLSCAEKVFGVRYGQVSLPPATTPCEMYDMIVSIATAIK